MNQTKIVRLFCNAISIADLLAYFPPARWIRENKLLRHIQHLHWVASVHNHSEANLNLGHR